jgi:hypothetical protein
VVGRVGGQIEELDLVGVTLGSGADLPGMVGLQIVGDQDRLPPVP